MLPNKIFLVIILLLSVFATAAASAHGIWFAERSKQLALIFGVGADDLNMVERLPLITDIAAYDVLQKPVETSLRASEFLVTANLDAHPAIVAAAFDNGIWSQKKDGSWSRGRRQEIENAVLSAAVLKFTVHLRSPLAEPLGNLPGQDLQIVPDDAILPDKKDSEIGLRVLYRGKPVAGATVVVDYVNDPDATPIVSDEDGRVRLRIRNQGLNVIQAYYATKNDDPEVADKVQIVATLSFVLPHEPE
ncbi:MAG TPA: DUF4198 domain-containing protein [Woeseiaceae bacterium]|nr:DUF4198 domain-containing protein [Woeseiaceae bacterium]